MNKGERETLARLLRARFKVLREDVKVRQAEMVQELEMQIQQRFAAAEKQYDDVMFRLKLIVDDANRQANDLGRELWGLEKWGERHDRQVITLAHRIDNPSVGQKREERFRGEAEIERRVKAALLELTRQETELLTELATSGLESAEAKAFFDRIPAVGELVPAYRMRSLAGPDGDSFPAGA